MRWTAILFSMLVTGCTTTARMSERDLNNFKIDCSKKQEQIDFLRSQWPSDRDKFINAFTVTSSGGFVLSSLDGTYEDRRKLNDGYHTSTIRILIYQIQSTCPN